MISRNAYIQLPKNIHLILAIAVLATMPFFKVNNVVICMFFAYAVYLAFKQPPYLSKFAFILLLPAWLFLTYVVGVFWSSDVGEGLHQVEKRLHLIVFPVSFFLYRDKFSQRDVDRILAFFVFLCFVASVVCYAVAIINVITHNSFTVTLERQYYYFSYKHLTQAVDLEPIYLSLFINFCILIIQHSRLQLAPAFKWSMVVYFVVFNVLVAAKIGILCMIAIFLIYGLFSISNRLIRVLVCLLAPLILAATIFLSPFLKDRFILPLDFEYDSAYAGTWNSFTQRLAIWSCSMEAIKNVFPLGYGTGDGKPELYKSYVKMNYIRGIEDRYNAHNEYIHTLLDLGVFGLIILIAILGSSITLSIRYSHSLLLYLIILMFIYFFIEVVLTRRFGIFFFSFFYSLLVMELASANRLRKSDS